MNTFIHSLRQKPAHVRHNIALGTAVVITLLVFIGWLAAMVTSGKFSFAIASSGQTAATTETTPSFSSLLGAAGAAFSTNATGTAVAPLSVVDQRASSTLERTTTKEDRTVIPF